MALGTCRECGKHASSEARSCPHCGAPQPVRPPTNATRGAGQLYCLACNQYVYPQTVRTERFRGAISVDLPGPVDAIIPITSAEERKYCPLCNGHLLIPNRPGERMSEWEKEWEKEHETYGKKATNAA